MNVAESVCLCGKAKKTSRRWCCHGCKVLRRMVKNRWVAKNRGKVRAQNSKWAKANRAKVNFCARRSYRKRKAEGFVRDPEKTRLKAAAYYQKNALSVLASQKLLRLSRNRLKLAFRLTRLQLKIEVGMNQQREIDGFVKKVGSMSTEDLKREFAEGISIVRDKLLWLAAILGEIELRGQKVSGDRFLVGLLRKIGRGDLLVDVVVRYAGCPYVLKAVSRLPVAEQEEVLAKSEADVSNRFRKQRQKLHYQESGGCATKEPSLLEQAAKGSPGDVAEMVMEIVNKSSDPKAVAQRLIPLLQRIKNTKEAS